MQCTHLPCICRDVAQSGVLYPCTWDRTYLQESLSHSPTCTYRVPAARLLDFAAAQVSQIVSISATLCQPKQVSLCQSIAGLPCLGTHLSIATPPLAPKVVGVSRMQDVDVMLGKLVEFLTLLFSKMPRAKSDWALHYSTQKQ